MYFDQCSKFWRYYMFACFELHMLIFQSDFLKLQSPIHGVLSVSNLQMALSHLMPLGFFYTPWKHQKLIGFQFLGGIKRRKWLEMSECINHHVKVSIIKVSQLICSLINILMYSLYWLSELCQAVDVEFFQGLKT